MIYHKGKELICIIASHDYLLCDATCPDDRAFNWEELQTMGPASELIIGHNYILVPKPINGQTLREAYSATMGFPSLTIGNPSDPRWLGLYVHSKAFPDPNVALFSRLFLEKEFLVASSPVTDLFPNPDAVAMPYWAVLENFQRHFRIVKEEEFFKQPVIN